MFYKKKYTEFFPDWGPLYKLVADMGGKPVEVDDYEFIENPPREISGDFILLTHTSDTYIGKADFRAAKNILEMKTMLPVIIFDASIYGDYDEGLEDLWIKLYQSFTDKGDGIKKDNIGLLGMTEYDIPKLGFNIPENGKNIICYGWNSGFSSIQKAADNQKNIVLAPSFLKTARYLSKRFGTPYEIGFPVEDIPGHDDFIDAWKKLCESNQAPGRTLMIHQQILANTLRKEMRQYYSGPIVNASFFIQDKEIKEGWDIPLNRMEDLKNLVEKGSFDMIIADEVIRGHLTNYKGSFCPLNHYPVSGKELAFGQIDFL